MSFPFLYDQREGPVTFANGDEGRGVAGMLADMVSGDNAIRTDVGTMAGMAPDQSGEGADFNRFAKTWRAAEQSQIYVDNTYARQAAMEEAVDRRIAAVRDATGVTLENYTRIPPTTSTMAGFIDDPQPDDRREHFHAQLRELAQKHPDKADRIKADLPIEDEAKALARTSEQAAQVAAGEMSTLGGLAASLGGGIAGSFRDPLQVSLLFAGGGAGTAPTAAARIAQVAIREGLINAGAVALSQPSVQAWRDEAGLRSGVMPALENVGMAFLFGAILGGPIQGVRELRGADRLAVERTMAGVASPEEAMTAARVLDVPEAEQGAIRMAAEAAEAERVVVGERLADVPDELDADLTAAALRNAEDANQPPAAAAMALEIYSPTVERYVPPEQRAVEGVTADEQGGFTPSQMKALLNEETEGLINMWHEVRSFRDLPPSNASDSYKKLIGAYARELESAGVLRATSENEIRGIMLDKRLRGETPQPLGRETVDVGGIEILPPERQIAPSNQFIAQRLAEAQPKTQAEARAVVAEAMEETGTKNIIAATRADLESGVALRGRDEAGAPIRHDPDAEIEKMPRGDPMDKMFTLDDEGRPKLVSRATLAKQGERDALFGDLVRSCK